MSNLFEQYKTWREGPDYDLSGGDSGESDKKAFMQYAKLRRLDDDDFEELELQYDDYLIELETE